MDCIMFDTMVALIPTVNIIHSTHITLLATTYCSIYSH